MDKEKYVEQLRMAVMFLESMNINASDASSYLKAIQLLQQIATQISNEGDK